MILIRDCNSISASTKLALADIYLQEKIERSGLKRRKMKTWTEPGREQRRAVMQKANRAGNFVCFLSMFSHFPLPDITGCMQWYDLINCQLFDPRTTVSACQETSRLLQETEGGGPEAGATGQWAVAASVRPRGMVSSCCSCLNPRKKK